MRPTWTRRLLAFLILAAFLLPACASAKPLPKEGHWEGSPSVSFDVTASGEVVNFSIDIDDCVLTAQRALAISDGQIEIGTVSAEGIPENDGIVGTFSTPTELSGTYAYPFSCLSGGLTITTSHLSIDEDGNSAYVLSTWDATWQEP